MTVVEIVAQVCIRDPHVWADTNGFLIGLIVRYATDMCDWISRRTSCVDFSSSIYESIIRKADRILGCEGLSVSWQEGILKLERRRVLTNLAIVVANDPPNADTFIEKTVSNLRLSPSKVSNIRRKLGALRSATNKTSYLKKHFGATLSKGKFRTQLAHLSTGQLTELVSEMGLFEMTESAQDLDATPICVSLETELPVPKRTDADLKDEKEPIYSFEHVTIHQSDPDVYLSKIAEKIVERVREREAARTSHLDQRAIIERSKEQSRK